MNITIDSGHLRRVVIIGDIAGSSKFHVGDEAMFEANVLMLRRLLPAASFTAVSLDPLASAARYGCDAVPRLDLTGAIDQRSAEMQRINAWMALARHPQQLPQSLRAVAEADLLVISGGGNLSSSWPRHILERLALARLARELGIPLIVLGQTLGPNLSPEDAQCVAEVLCSACWVGLREASSVALALSLGVSLERINYQADDAIGLQASSVSDPWPAVPTGQEPGPRLALTLHPVYSKNGDTAWLDWIARELDHVIETMSARLLFIPHVYDWQEETGDQGDRWVGDAIAMRLRNPGAMRVLDVACSRETIGLTQSADGVVSSRYHPLVFGLAAGAPCLGLAVDRYTAIKLHGALSHTGQEQNLLLLQGNEWPGLAEQIIDLFQRPQTSAAQRHIQVTAQQHRHDTREECLAALLCRLAIGKHDIEPSAGHAGQDLIHGLAKVINQPQHFDQNLKKSLEHWQRTSAEAQGYVLSLLEERQRYDQHYHELRTAFDSLEHSRQTAEAYARDLVRARADDAEEMAQLRALIASYQLPDDSNLTPWQRLMVTAKKNNG